MTVWVVTQGEYDDERPVDVCASLERVHQKYPGEWSQEAGFWSKPVVYGVGHLIVEEALAAFPVDADETMTPQS